MGSHRSLLPSSVALRLWQTVSTSAEERGEERGKEGNRERKKEEFEQKKVGTKTEKVEGIIHKRSFC